MGWRPLWFGAGSCRNGRSPAMDRSQIQVDGLFEVSMISKVFKPRRRRRSHVFFHDFTALLPFGSLLATSAIRGFFWQGFPTAIKTSGFTLQIWTDEYVASTTSISGALPRYNYFLLLPLHPMKHPVLSLLQTGFPLSLFVCPFRFGRDTVC